MKDARIQYRDIIDHDHYEPVNHARMSRLNRAAQFAPFAALTGYEDLIRESARHTEARQMPDEDQMEAINARLAFLLQQESPTEADFTFFLPDAKKEGGSYAVLTGSLRRYDPLERSITLSSGELIRLEDLIQIDCPTYDALYGV